MTDKNFKCKMTQFSLHNLDGLVEFVLISDYTTAIYFDQYL